MKKLLLTLPALPLMAAASAAEKPALAPSEIVAAAPATDWVQIAADDLMVMDLAPDAKGRARRVIIQLMPPPLSQGWVANIRALVAERWFDGVSVNRVQDNYVVQWGDANGEDPAKAKALPANLRRMAESDYVLSRQSDVFPLTLLKNRDSYAAGVGFLGGFPVALMPQAGGKGVKQVWPVHCYGMVGVGRGLSPDTGTGAELYTVIGHAPRHLDRNIALVGRVVEGIEHLSSLPRGTEALGFYKTDAERTPLVSVRLGSTLADLPRYEYLSTQSRSFQAYAEARSNRRDAFFNLPAGGADICNITLPIRRVQPGS